jgi:peroxiredoxin
MQGSLDRFNAAGIRLVAISVDPPEVSRDLRQHAGYMFTFLSDPKLDAIRRYDLVVREEDIARPAEFLLDASGIVRWRNLTNDYYVRARPDEVLRAAQALK